MYFLKNVLEMVGVGEHQRPAAEHPVVGVGVGVHQHQRRREHRAAKGELAAEPDLHGRREGEVGGLTSSKFPAKVQTCFANEPLR